MTAMRRSIFIMAGMTACVLLLSVFFQDLGDRTGVLRYQQHREQPSEDELEPCAVCGGAGELCTHLPIIRIETGGQTIPGRPIPKTSKDLAGSVAYDEWFQLGEHGEREVIVQFSTKDQKPAWNHTDSPSANAGEALLRFRGNSSRWFLKGSYSLKLIENGSPEQRQRQALLGMTPGSEWILHGPCLDRTLLRNYLCYTVAGQVMGYAPNCRFCELVIDGEYQGIYLLVEAVAKGDGRIELTEPDGNTPVTSWIVRIDRDYKANVPLNSFGYYTFRLDNAQASLLYPGKNTVTPEKIKYVAADFSSIERQLYSAEFLQNSDQYAQFLDTRAFAQYYILNEFFGNVDAGRYSTYYYKDLRGKMTPVVWDFNNACDNYISYAYADDGFFVIRMSPFDRLMCSADFVEEVIRQYRALRKGCLSDAGISGIIDGARDYLGGAIDRNNARWSSLYDMTQYNTDNFLYPASRNYQNYEESVEQLKTWLLERGQWMDGHIESLRQYCHPSRFANQMLG